MCSSASREAQKGIGKRRKQQIQEDNLQLEDAKHYGAVRGAKYVEYTDKNGKTVKVETGNTTGGTYKAQYSEKVANYAKMSKQQLETELKIQQSISNENYQKFTRQAASKSGSLISAAAQADAEIKAIKQVLRRKK